MTDPGAERPVLSQATLDGIRSIGSRGPELLRQVVEAFLSSAPVIVAEIREAVESEDAERLCFTAHSLKSCSGSVGATRLADLAADAEAAGSNGTPREVDALLCRIEAELSEVHDALRSELA